MLCRHLQNLWYPSGRQQRKRLMPKKLFLYTLSHHVIHHSVKLHEYVEWCCNIHECNAGKLQWSPFISASFCTVFHHPTYFLLAFHIWLCTHSHSALFVKVKYQNSNMLTQICFIYIHVWDWEVNRHTILQYCQINSYQNALHVSVAVFVLHGSCFIGQVKSYITKGNWYLRAVNR